jgi:hypothetical protein
MLRVSLLEICYSKRFDATERVGRFLNYTSTLLLKSVKISSTIAPRKAIGRQLRSVRLASCALRSFGLSELRVPFCFFEGILILHALLAYNIFGDCTSKRPCHRSKDPLYSSIRSIARKSDSRPTRLCLFILLSNASADFIRRTWRSANKIVVQFIMILD